MQTTQLLTYAAPPLLGAFIGYLTNKVAIRMLFRPLKPWYVFGLRVPMTPGVIPSKRHELAQNMGEMVGEHLMTATDIGAALSAERFQNHLHLLIDDRVRDLLDRDLGPIITVVPRRFRAYVKIGTRTLKYQMRDGVYSYIQSDSFAETVTAAIEAQLDTFGTVELNELITAEGRESVYTVINGLVSRLLADPQVVEWLGNYLVEYLTQAAVEGKTLADLLPSEFQDLLCATIEDQAPLVLQQLSVMLAEPAVRDKIIQAIKGGVDNFLDTLGPMGAMARGFVDMDSLDEKIRTYLEDKEEDLSTWLQSPEVQERVAQMLVRQTRAFFAGSLADLLARVPMDKLQAGCHQAAVQILAVLRAQGVQDTLAGMIQEQIEEMLDQGRISLSGLADMILPGDSGSRIRETLVCELVTMLRSRRVRRMLDSMLNTMVDQLAAKPVGILQNLMPAGVRQGITDYIILSANRMLLKEVPGLVASLNIKEMVTEKVDSLDLLRLERLLLSIMEEQFKYINIFGALLGFLIGLINLLVLHLP